MKVKQTIITLSICVGMLVVVGCATIFTKDSQQITFNSKPKGAHIQVGPYECKTPCSLLIPKGKSYSIEATYKGQRKVVPLTQKMHGATLVNVLFWPGFVVDSMTDKIEKYDPAEYMFHFEEPNTTD